MESTSCRHFASQTVEDEPGGCLRGWLTQLGHPLPALREAGLVTGVGYDSYVRRIVFPLEGNLYGRSISAAAPPHRFLPGAKGGLYSWAQAQSYPEVILVEGLFDYAVLWQAGFRNVTCSLGTHPNARQFRQLCDGPRTGLPKPPNCWITICGWSGPMHGRTLCLSPSKAGHAEPG